MDRLVACVQYTFQLPENDNGFAFPKEVTRKEEGRLAYTFKRSGDDPLKVAG